MWRETLAVTAVCALAGGAFGIAAAPVQAKTIRACVKKSNGEVRIVKKKSKCKKGWKKTSWNSEGGPGSSGEQGPAGPNWVVKDGAGTVLGRFAGIYHAGLIPEFEVIADDGGIFQYSMDGVLDNDNGWLLFRNSACTQAVVFELVADNLAPVLKSAGGAGRAVFQVKNAPTANAYRVAAGSVAELIPGGTLYERDSDNGVCSPVGNPPGFVVTLVDAPAPVVATPPLSVVAP